MPNTINIAVSVTDISIDSVAEIIADKLWTDKNVEDLAQNIYDECELENREDNLKAMCELILQMLLT